MLQGLEDDWKVNMTMRRLQLLVSHDVLCSRSFSFILQQLFLIPLTDDSYLTLWKLVFISLKEI